MTIEYRCPVCKATNSLTKDNTTCRRCKSDLSTIYKLREANLHKVLNKILKRRLLQEV